MIQAFRKTLRRQFITWVARRFALIYVAILGVAFVSLCSCNAAGQSESESDGSHSADLESLTPEEQIEALLAEVETAIGNATFTPKFFEQYPWSTIEMIEKAAAEGNDKASLLYGIYLQVAPVPNAAQRAASEIRKAAEAGVDGAAWQYGICLYEGLGVVPDQKAAIDWYAKGAKRGERMAEFLLGVLYSNGVEGVLEQDGNKAVQLIQNAADKGLSSAASSLSNCYFDGKFGLERDLTRAEQYMQRAIAGGNPGYLGALAWQKSEEEQFDFLLKAADAGDYESQLHVGMGYLAGLKGQQQDFEKARKWLEKAAFQGQEKEAFVLLGRIHCEALGVPGDMNLGAWCFERARMLGEQERSVRALSYLVDNLDHQKLVAVCEQHDLSGFGGLKELPPHLRGQVAKHAMQQLPIFQEESESTELREELAELEKCDYLPSPPNDPSRLKREYLRTRLLQRKVAWVEAASNGSPIAQYICGLLISTSLVPEADLSANLTTHTELESSDLQLYRKAAEQGLPIAQASLGKRLINGTRAQEDKVQGAQWLASSAASSYPPGVNLFAWALAQGHGLQMNELLSAKLCEYAYRHGSVNAAYSLAIKYRDGQGVPQSYILARTLYVDAAAKGHASAMNNLAKMLYSHQGGAFDREGALRLWRQAADLGNATAINNLAKFSQGSPLDSRMDGTVRGGYESTTGGEAYGSDVEERFYRDRMREEIERDYP